MIQIPTRLSAIFIATAASLLIAGDSQAQATHYAPVVGQPHADFILPSIEDGKPLQLSAFRGKKVLLMHFASW